MNLREDEHQSDTHPMHYWSIRVPEGITLNLHSAMSAKPCLVLGDCTVWSSFTLKGPYSLYGFSVTSLASFHRYLVLSSRMIRQLFDHRANKIIFIRLMQHLMEHVRVIIGLRSGVNHWRYVVVCAINVQVYHGMHV